MKVKGFRDTTVFHNKLFGHFCARICDGYDNAVSFFYCETGGMVRNNYQGTDESVTAWYGGKKYAGLQAVGQRDRASFQRR